MTVNYRRSRKACGRLAEVLFLAHHASLVRRWWGRSYPATCAHDESLDLCRVERIKCIEAVSSPLHVVPGSQNYLF